MNTQLDHDLNVFVKRVDNASDVLRRYPPIILLILSVVFNTLSIMVLRRPKINTCSVSVYLRGIALMDLCATMIGFIPTILKEWFDLIAEESSTAACKLIRFFLFGFSDLAVWLLTAFTVDRLIVVVSPLKARLWCSKRRAYYVTACIVILGVVKNISSLWTRGERWIPDMNNTLRLVQRCGVVYGNEFYEDYVRSWLGFSFYIFIPLFIILISNGIIVIINCRSSAQRGALSQVASNVNMNNILYSQNNKKAKSSLTKMMFAVTLMFVLLVPPSLCLYISIPYWPKHQPYQSMLKLAFALGDILICTNHTMNFVMYVLSGRRFRNEFLLLCGCKSSTLKTHSKTVSNCYCQRRNNVTCNSLNFRISQSET